MDLSKVPKGAKKDASEIKNTKTKEHFTLMKMLTNDGTQPFYVDFLKEQSTKKGNWAAYYKFFIQNQSGDVETMSETNRKYVEKMISDIHAHYEETML